MKGANIEGFIVGDLLGSGRTGLLYTAVHASTGQRAIVRVVTREDRVETELFIQEASSHLPRAGGPELVRARLEDGRIVHLVFNGPGTLTTAVDQRAVATDRLPPRPEQRPRTPFPDWLVPTLLVLVVVAFAVLAALVLMRRTGPEQVIVLQQGGGAATVDAGASPLPPMVAERATPATLVIPSASTAPAPAPEAAARPTEVAVPYAASSSRPSPVGVAKPTIVNLEGVHATRASAGNRQPDW